MKTAQILIASDVVSDAELVRKLLRDEFENVFISTSPDQAVGDFEHCMPDVLILAFNTLEKAEGYYLGLYRLSAVVHTVMHRTIILCGKDEVRRVYEQCRKEYFDDYVLFWPMTNDAQRLPMAVTHALRDLERSQSGAPAAEMARQVRRIAELEELLQRQLSQGEQYVEMASRSLVQAEAGIDAAIGSLSKGIIEGRYGDALEVRDPALLQLEFDTHKAEEVRQLSLVLNDVVQTMGNWVGEMRQQLSPHLESMDALKKLAEHFRPVILVVDDDEFVRKLTGEMLRAEPYDLIFAASGAEAINILRKTRPDLILLDIAMPEIDGLETLRRLKASPQFAGIPVMMITGQSEKDLVMECLNADAMDFLVKPMAREILLKKVSGILAG